MLNFEASCTNRPLYNEHENVICAKEKIYEKKIINDFWSKMKLEQLEFFNF